MPVPGKYSVAVDIQVITSFVVASVRWIAWTIAERYERVSVLLTSNLPLSKWDVIFKDPMTTAAVIDRLVHHRVSL